MTHTPGPWKAMPNGQINSKNYNIAQVYKYAREIEIKESEANAILISCAPELLEAIKMLTVRMNYEGNIDLIRDEGLIEHINYVVTKSEGR